MAQAVSDGERSVGIVRFIARSLDTAPSLEEAAAGFLPHLARGVGARAAVLRVSRRGSAPVLLAEWADEPADGDRSGADGWLSVPVRAGGQEIGALELRGVATRNEDLPVAAVLEVTADLVAQHVRRLEAEEDAAVATDVIRPREGIPVVTYIDALDGVSTTLYMSPQTEQLTGYTEREWLADPHLWERIIHPDDRERVLTENARTMNASDPFRSEYRIIARDGTVRWVLDEADLVEEGGVPRFWRGFMADVTERKAAEVALAQAEARYRALVENIPALTYIEAPEDDRMLYVSPQVEALSGYTPEERLDEPALWRRIIHPDDAAAFAQATGRAERTGAPFSLEYRIIARDGRTVWLHDEAVLVRDPEGNALLWQGVVFDVTARVEADAERRRLLSHLVSAQEEERSRIAVRIHDGPIQKMTAVDLRLQMLRPQLPEQGRTVLDVLQRMVRETIDGMRALLVELRPPELEEGLATALARYLASPPSGVAVRFSVDDSLDEEPAPEVRGLAFRIAQEAIANVWTHAGAEHVHVAIGRSRGELSVTITDDGRGFSPDALRPVEGHIGLQTMRERAEMGGGRLEIRSAPSDGTTVSFRLPWS